MKDGAADKWVEEHLDTIRYLAEELGDDGAEAWSNVMGRIVAQAALDNLGPAG